MISLLNLAYFLKLTTLLADPCDSCHNPPLQIRVGLKGGIEQTSCKCHKFLPVAIYVCFLHWRIVFIQKNDHLFPIMYDISQDYVVDATLEYVHSSERDLARKHISKLKSLDLIENSLIIFDRGYFSTDMFNFLVDAGCSCLMRIKKSTTSLTGSEEDDIVLDSVKYHTNIRVVQVELSTGEIEYLVTNILDPNITPEMLKKLYHKR